MKILKKCNFTAFIFLFMAFTFQQIVKAQEVSVPEIKAKDSVISKLLKTEKEKIAQQKSNFTWRKYEGTALPEYEKLTFSVMWQFVSVAEATLELRGFDEIEGRQAHHIYSEAKTKPFFDEVFRVRDVNEAWLDKESMTSLGFVSNIDEGGYKKQESAEFDHIRKTYTLKNTGKMQMGDIPGFVQDVMTSLYYMRTIDMKVGAEYIVDAHSGDKTWPLSVKVVKEEKKKTPAGTFECFVLEPAIRKDAGIMNATGEMQVWITKDSRRLPVYLKVKVPIGSASAQLEKIESGIPENIQNKGN